MTQNTPNDNIVFLESPKNTTKQITDGTAIFRRLSDLGYVPIPIVPHDKQFAKKDNTLQQGGKSPGRFDPSSNTWRGLSGWSRFLDTPPTPHTLSIWESWTSGGMPGAGILTGNIIAIDIDITHQELAKATIRSAKETLGDTPFIRFGNAPKAMLIYRLNTGTTTKMRSATFDLDDHKRQVVEVLGKGQQFVAFGIHPSTKKSYMWPVKSLLDTPANKLPTVTLEKIQEFLSCFEMLAGEIFGAEMKSLPSDDNSPHVSDKELSDRNGFAQQAAAALSPSLSDDYHSWVRVGLAIKGAFPDDEPLAFELFDEFSSKSESYTPEETLSKWQSFKPERIGAGTLYKLAKDCGWQPPHALPEDEFTTIIESKPLDNIWLSDFEGVDLPPREWLLGKYLIRGHVTTLVAPGGVGKSTLTLAWAASLASSIDLVSAKPHETGKVWLINNEDDTLEMKRRFAAMRQYYNIDWNHLRNRIAFSDSTFTIALRGPNGAINPSPQLQAAITFIKENNIAALIVDPLVETHQAEENDNVQMKRVMSFYRQIAHETNCAVCLVHHTSKPQGGSSEGFAGNANAGRGASSVVNAARISLTLFDMSAKDAERYGITEDSRARYVRLDDAKANLSLKSQKANWFYRETVKLENGDEVGVLRPEKLVEKEVNESRNIVDALLNFEPLRAAGRAPLPDVVSYLQNEWIIDPEMTPRGAQNKVAKALEKPVPVLQIDNCFIWFEREEGVKRGGRIIRFGNSQQEGGEA
jgi:hypothetical protein